MTAPTPVRLNELEALTEDAEHGSWVKYSEAEFHAAAWAALPALVAFARQELARHAPVTTCEPVDRSWCDWCGTDWPCETVRTASDLGIEVGES